MKLDRNVNPDKTGKYALVKLRMLTNRDRDTTDNEYEAIQKAINTLDAFGAICWGNSPDTEFFVTRLRDKYAAPALAAYALAAFRDDPEFGLEVLNLAKRAAEHPHQKVPD